jgi:phosphomannomutase
MSKLMVSVSGIRGIFGETLTPDIVLSYAAHLGMFLGKGTVIVGRDSRVTGPLMLNAVVAGLRGVGCDVIDLGIVSTPTVLLAVEESDAIGGIAITASHNPAQWNAMKLVDGNGMFLFPERAEAFLATLEDPIQWVGWDAIGSYQQDASASQRHIDKVLAIPYLDAAAIKARKYKVVIDTVNGAGGVIAPQLLRELGCEVIELNTEPTGIFAHTPEPLNENLTQLEDAVKKHGADIGFATDPDVDRLAIVAEDGTCIGEEFSLLLAQRFVLAKNPGDIVTNLSSSMASEDNAALYGVQVHRTKVGEINVGKKMKELNSPIGGEGNGGVICSDVHYTRDAPAGIALILGYMAQTGKTVGQLTAEIPHYYFYKGKITVAPDQLDGIMTTAEEVFADDRKDRTDGLKILGENYWIHIRKSGTEPIVRVYVESESAERSKQLFLQTREKLMA